MITFKNRMPDPIKLTIDNDTVIINEYEEYQFDNKTDSVEFIVEDESVKKTHFFGYLLLVVVGLIGFILEMLDSKYLDFRKALSLPVKSRIYNIENDVLVMIEEPRKSNIGFCIINSNTSTKTNVIIDEEEIQKQYKFFQKECLAVFLIPILIVVMLLYIFISSKNIVAYIISAVLAIVVFYIWYRHHNKNIKTISNIIRNKSL